MATAANGYYTVTATTNGNGWENIFHPRVLLQSGIPMVVYSIYFHQLLTFQFNPAALWCYMAPWTKCSTRRLLHDSMEDGRQTSERNVIPCIDDDADGWTDAGRGCCGWLWERGIFWLKLSPPEYTRLSTRCDAMDVVTGERTMRCSSSVNPLYSLTTCNRVNQFHQSVCLLAFVRNRAYLISILVSWGWEWIKIITINIIVYRQQRRCRTCRYVHPRPVVDSACTIIHFFKLLNSQ